MLSSDTLHNLFPLAKQDFSRLIKSVESVWVTHTFKIKILDIKIFQMNLCHSILLA